MTDIIRANVDSAGNKVTTFESSAFEEQELVNEQVPGHEQQAIAEIGQYVRSLVGEDTPDLVNLKVERIHLQNDTPFYSMEIKFADQFPIILQTDIGEEWKIHSMRHKEDYTVAKLRYQGITF